MLEGVAVVLLGILAFGALIGLVSSVDSVMKGWSRLGKRFAVEQAPRGAMLSGQVLAMNLHSGWRAHRRSNYADATRLIVSAEGLYLERRWPPLLIPWNEVQVQAWREVMDAKHDSVELRLGRGAAYLHVKQEAFDAMRPFLSDTRAL